LVCSDDENLSLPLFFDERKTMAMTNATAAPPPMAQPRIVFAFPSLISPTLRSLPPAFLLLRLVIVVGTTGCTVGVITGDGVGFDVVVVVVVDVEVVDDFEPVVGLDVGFEVGLDDVGFEEVGLDVGIEVGLTVGLLVDDDIEGEAPPHMAPFVQNSKKNVSSIGQDDRS